MLDRLRSLFSAQNLDAASSGALRRETVFVNFYRYRILTLVTIPIFAILLVLDLLNRQKGLWGETGYRELFLIHSVTGALLIALAIALHVRAPRDAEAITRRHRLTVLLVTITVMISQVATMTIDVHLKDQITTYVVMAVGLGAMVLMPLLEGTLFYALCLVLFLLGIGFSSSEASKMYGHYLNGSILTLLAWVLSRIVYAGHRNNFINRITIRRQSEDIRARDEKLQLSEMEYRQLFENSPIGVFRTTASGTVQAGNRSLLHTIGFASLEELNETGLLNLYVDPGDRARLWEMVRRGPVSGFETVFRRGDGATIPVSISGYLVRDERGEPQFLEGTIEDITERRKNERALRESEERFRLLAENSGDVILTMDTNLRVTYVSPAVYKLRGVTPEESEGQSLDQIVTPASLEAAFADYLRVQPEIERGENPTSHLELELYRKDGSTIWVEIALTPLRDDTGSLKGFMGVYHDISERRRAEKELRESEEKYKFLVENTTDVIWIFDLSSMCYTFASNSLERILGYSPDEAPGMTLDQLFSPETRKRVQAGFTRIVAGKEPSDRILIEAEHIARDGRAVWMEINAVLKRDERGRPVAFNGVSRDITERKRNEQALRESERRLGDIINFLPIATLVIDREGRITAWNRALEEMTGAKAADMIGKGNHEYALPFYGERRPILVDRVFSPEEELRTKYSHIRREGGILEAESFIPKLGENGAVLQGFASPLYGSDGSIIGAIESIRDVTEMRRVERELKKAEEKFRTILETMDSGYYEVDLKGTMVYCNPALKNFLGYGEDELEGKNFRDYMDEEESERITKIFNKVYTSGKPSDDFYWKFSKKGRESAYSAASAYPIMNEGGAIVGFRGTVRDINALKAAQEAAEAANRSKSIFLASMSHEIRTPMNAILGFAQLMMRDPGLTGTLRDHLDIINRSGEHLLSLINDILEMSKIEAGRAAFMPKTFDLHGLIEDMEIMFRVRAEAKGLHVLAERTGDVPRWVITDEGKLRQVLINLLGNAVKFTEEGGVALRVGSMEKDTGAAELTIEVEDTGPGIDEDEIKRLFKAFEQTRSGIKSGGTGLGLALSQGFLRIMGGEITLASTPGKGSIFRVRLPVEIGREEEAETVEARRRVSRLQPGQGEVRILVADDRETNRQLLTRLLNAVGFTTREAENGAEAVRAFHDWNPRIVLMDMTMPVMDGYEATRLIKSDPAGKGTTVIAVTASAFEEDRRRVMENGANGYLSKPFKEDELFRLIHECAGVILEYEDGAECETGAVTDDTAALGDAVASLPEELLRSLHDATVTADIDRLNELCESAAAVNPLAGQKLQEMARRYEYEAILRLVKQGE